MVCAHCTNEFLSRKPGFLLLAMHGHPFCWFSFAPPVFLFLGFLPLPLNHIWRIFCVMCGEEGGWTLFVCLQKLHLTDMFERLHCYIQLQLYLNKKQYFYLVLVSACKQLQENQAVAWI
jgi:hypothetical protein